MFKFDKPTLVTLTAPTCSGKSHILNHLTARPEPGFCRIVSTTTRPPRNGEVNGVDYYFIDEATSRRMESNGEFAELVEFRGVRYGVTNKEMERCMGEAAPPIIILEPRGVEIYQEVCRARGWEIFKVFVYTPESIRVSRLNARTSNELMNLPRNTDNQSAFENIIAGHTDRLLSMTREERRWQSLNTWDLLIPGYDLQQAVNDLKQGIKWRNYRNAQLNT